MRNLAIMIAVLALTALAVAPETRADFYSYTDSSGVVHITNVPKGREYRLMMKESGKRAASSRVVKRNYDELIHASAERHGIDPHLVRAIVKAESDFNPKAVSSAGARGLMQLMPETARRMGVDDIHDPEENIDGGIRYLRKLLAEFDWQVPLAVAAYNAGENAVWKYGDIPPYAETRNYVKRVLKYYRQYRSRDN